MQKINDQAILKYKNFKCLIIDNFTQNIEEKVLYSLINQSNNLKALLLLIQNYQLKISNLI